MLLTSVLVLAASCSSANWLLTVQRKGRDVETFTGTLTVADVDEGVAGSGQLVTTFTMP